MFIAPSYSDICCKPRELRNLRCISYAQELQEMVIRRYANRGISARNGGDNPVPSPEKPYKAL